MVRDEIAYKFVWDCDSNSGKVWVIVIVVRLG